MSGVTAIAAGRFASVSVETTALETSLPSVISPGMQVYVASPPSARAEQIVRRAAQLAAAGLAPVPHVAARGFESRKELADFLKALRREGAERALVLGGDLEHARGPFQSARDILATGLFAELGFEGVGFASYPEAHRRIGAPLLQKELALKLAAARRQSLNSWLVTQFSFDLAAIAAHVEKLRMDGVEEPISIGVAGPTSLKSLARFAQICGVKASISFISAQSGKSLWTLSAYDPTLFTQRLAERLLRDASVGPIGLHIFSFGGLEKTTAWLRAIGFEKDGRAIAETRRRRTETVGGL